MDFTWLNSVISATQGVLNVLTTPPLSYFVSMIVLGAMIKIIMQIIRPEKGGYIVEGGMFSFISDAATGLGDIIAVATTAPLSYFLGLGLIGGIVGIVLRVVKKRG